MAEKCTNTSSPVDRWMKPKPLAPLNHFTVPFSLTNCSFRLCADGIFSVGHHELSCPTGGWSQIEPVYLPSEKQKPQRPSPSLDPRWPDRLRLLCLFDRST